MKKKLWNVKLVLIFFAIFFSLGLIIFVIIFKSFFPFKPSFYAYSSYVDPQTVKQINKKYSYKEYGSVNEFEFAMENNKAIAGISSDYSIISLIKQGKIAPIRKEMENIIKKQYGLDNVNWIDYWTEEAIEQMQEYDKYLNEEKTQFFLKKQFNNSNSYYDSFKFSDFVVPYFINDKVIAFDTNKVLGKTFNMNENENPLTFKDKAPTLDEALLKINEQSKFKNIKTQWTKNERENIVIGSTFNDPNDNWDTKINEENYLKYLDNFAKIVKKGTGAPISDTKKNLFDTDSDIILNNLINPTSKINVAMIYNGDALDAYYGHDNFKEIQDGDRVRIIRTKYTIRVLDCFVVSSSVNQTKKEKMLEDFNATLFDGMFLSKEELKKQDEENFNRNGIIKIFDYVNYTPAAKGAYEYIYDEYFKLENEKFDEIARNIYKVAKTDIKLGIYVKAIAPIEKNVLSKLTLAFQKKINGY